MGIVLVIFAFLLLLIGLIGSVVPVIPGPTLGYIGLILLQWSGYASFSIVFLIVFGLITAVVTLTDYFLPALMTKKFGGSKYAMTGSILGCIAGLFFFPPIGIVIGPFTGALIGELIYNYNKYPNTDDIENPEKSNPLIVALGAFLAFILGTGAKLILSTLMIFRAVKVFFN